MPHLFTIQCYNGSIMKIALASDIHLEFGPIVLENTEGADVLILSGDICVVADLQEVDSPDLKYGHNGKMSQKSRMIHDFFYDCCNKFPHVVYVVGNHEHYDYDYKYTINDLKKYLKYLPNLQILDKETWTLFDEITFVGGTLWTNMNKGDSLTMWHCGRAMNDFRLIKNSNRMIHHKRNVYDENVRNEDGTLIVKSVDHYQAPSRWSVEDSVEDHNKMLDYIRLTTEDKSKKYVVVTHHAPTPLSIAECYKKDRLMNGAFHSDLSEFIMDRPQIKLWTHGHMHNVSDYVVGETRVVCNPRGYVGHEERAINFELKFMEIV